MARDSESRTQAKHITEVILATEPNTKLGRFITHLAGNAQCRRKLKWFMLKNKKKLHEVKFPDEDGTLTNFDEKADEEVLSELYAIYPFFNHNQNLIGPKAQGYDDRKMDIMKFTREDFLDYICDRFDIDDPDSWDEEDIDQQKESYFQWKNMSGTSSPTPTSGSTSSSTKKKKSATMKKNIANYTDITECKRFVEWYQDLDATAVAERTHNVLNPDYVPDPEEVEEHEDNKAHIFAMLVRQGKTGPIKNILRKIKNHDGQLAMKKIVEYYSKDEAGRLRAQEIRALLNRKVPANHQGQVAKCILQFEALVDEHNTIVGVDEMIDSASKYEKLKDHVSNIDGFTMIEDVMAVSKVTSPDEKINRYRSKALNIDSLFNKMAEKSSERLRGSAPRSNLQANVAESVFGVSPSSVDEDVVVPDNEDSCQDDDDVRSNLLNAFVTQTYQKGRGKTNYNRKFDPATFLPQEEYKKLSREGKRVWNLIPKEDRALIVAMVMNGVSEDTSAHPSPGNHTNSYGQASQRSSNNHNVSFRNDTNSFEALGNNPENTSNFLTPSNLRMNNLRISQAKQNVPDVESERAYSIMNAVHYPIKSSQLEESARKHHPGDIMRTLSVSNDIPTKPFSTTEQDLSWKYGESVKDNTFREPQKTSSKPLFDKMSRPFQRMRGNLSTNMLVITTENEEADVVRPYPRNTYKELNDVDDDGGSAYVFDDVGSVEGSDEVSIHSSYSIVMDDELALDEGVRASLEDNGENENEKAIDVSEYTDAPFGWYSKKQNTVGDSVEGGSDADDRGLQLDYAAQESPAIRFRFVADGQPNGVTELGSENREENRGAWMNLNAEDRLTIVEAIAERNNREDHRVPRESLVDSGCNVGVSGPGLSFIGYSEPAQYVNVTGIGGSTVNARLGSFRSLVSLDSGENAILIFNGYAHHPESPSATHSVAQMESNGSIIQGRPPRLGESAVIETLGGETIPLQFTDGLTHLDVAIPTEQDVNELRQITLTQDDELRIESADTVQAYYGSNDDNRSININDDGSG